MLFASLRMRSPSGILKLLVRSMGMETKVMQSVICKFTIPYLSQLPLMSFRYDIALPNGYFNLAVERDIQTHAKGRHAIAKDYTMTATLMAESHFDEIIRDFICALDKNFAQKG